MSAASQVRLGVLALLLGGGIGCAMGGQEGEDLDGSGTGGWSTSSPVDSSSGGTAGGATGTDTLDGETGTEPTDAPADTADTADTGAPPACGRALPRLYLSPDDSNSYASAALSRFRVGSGLDPGAVRTWELFNEARFELPAGPPGGVSLTAEWLEDGLGPEDYALQIQVGAEVLDPADRPPIHLVFTLDTSGSMQGAAMDRLHDACEAVAARLGAGDRVSMVTWDATQNIVLEDHAITGPSDPVLLGACDGLTASGGTDLSAGLATGYALAEAHWREGMTQRVVLISDGGANLGQTDEDLIARMAWKADGHAIFLVGIGVGSTGYDDDLMDAVTDAGRGAALFLPSAEEAWEMLYDRFVEVFEVAVTDVRLELELPERLRIVASSAEQIAVDPAEVRPQYLAPNGAMVFYNALSTPVPACLGDASEIYAKVRYVDPSGRPQAVEGWFQLGALRAGPSRNARKGRAVFLYAEALKASQAGGAALDRALDDAWIALDAAEADGPGDPDLARMREILSLL